MEKESFDDPTVGDYMNAHFTCIKIDREEYPDVDEKYMQMVQAMTGQGGWPLNVFLTPDLEPIYGGTYFPAEQIGGRASWMQTLRRIKLSWDQERDAVLAQSQKIMQHIQKDVPLHESTLWSDTQLLDGLAAEIDEEGGGFFSAPKFPLLNAWEWLYDLAAKLGDTGRLNMLKSSLSKMLMGGVMDQVNGGMMRYSTDNEWVVPHFEKMLYTQLGLLGLLSKLSARDSSDLLYHYYLGKTRDFLENVMCLEDGLYAASIDADSVDGEGYYYSFSFAEAEQILEEDGLMEAFGVRAEGNFEGRNILCFHEEKSLDKYEAYLREFGEIQKKRTPPMRDDKRIFSWNAALAVALARAYIHSCDTYYLGRFQALLSKCMEYRRSHDDGSWELCRIRYADGQYIEANGEDYGYYGLLNLYAYRLTQEEKYLDNARAAAERMESEYMKEGLYSKMKASEADGMLLYYQENDTTLASANGLMHEIYTVLSLLEYSTLYKSRAETIAKKMMNRVHKYPHYYAFLGASISAAVDMRSVHITASWDQIPLPLPMKYWLKKQLAAEAGFEAKVCTANSCSHHFSEPEEFQAFIRAEEERG